MKYTVKFSSAYKKDIKRISKRGLDLSVLNEVIIKLMDGETLSTYYQDHELIGNFIGFHELHLKFDWLLVYYISDNVLVLVRTGTHSDVFNN